MDGWMDGSYARLGRMRRRFEFATDRFDAVSLTRRHSVHPSALGRIAYKHALADELIHSLCITTVLSARITLHSDE
jgi:hypothetical protein